MPSIEIRKSGEIREKRWEQHLFIATFIILLLLGAGLRLHGLTTQSYWLDELYSISESRLIPKNITITFTVGESK